MAALSGRLSRIGGAVGMMVSLAVAGCGGGGGGSPTLSPPLPIATPISGPPASGGGATTSKGTTATVTIVESASAQTAVAMEQQYRVARGGRSPMFVSPNTAGVVVTATPSGGTPQNYVYDVSAGSSLCAVVGTTRTCTVTIEITPGTYAFTMTLYDEAPTGSPPAIPTSAHALGVSNLGSVTILPNTNNAIAFAIEGIVAGVSLPGGTTFLSAPSNGSSHTLGLAVVADDASGATISGTYATPISATLAESGGSGHTVLVKDGIATGTSAALTSSSDTLALQYDGGGAPGYTTTTTLSSSGATNTVRMSPLYVSGALAFTDQAQTKAITVSEAGSPFTSAPSVAWSCSGFSPAVSGTNASATYSVTSPALTVGAPAPSYSCPATVTITDALGTSISTTEGGGPSFASTCATSAANEYIGAKNGSGAYEVSTGVSCPLVVTAASGACNTTPACIVYAPNNATYPGTAVLQVQEANDTDAITSSSTCPSAEFSPTGAATIPGGAVSAAPASGQVSVTATSTSVYPVKIANIVCSVAINDGHGGTATVPITLDPILGSLTTISFPVIFVETENAVLLSDKMEFIADENGNFVSNWPSGYGYTSAGYRGWSGAAYDSSYYLSGSQAATCASTWGTSVGAGEFYGGEEGAYPALPGTTGYQSLSTIPTLSPLNGSFYIITPTQTWSQILASTYTC